MYAVYSQPGNGQDCEFKIPFPDTTKSSNCFHLNISGYVCMKVGWWILKRCGGHTYKVHNLKFNNKIATWFI